MQPCDTQNSIISLFTGISTVNQNCIDVLVGAKVSVITVAVCLCVCPCVSIESPSNSHNFSISLDSCPQLLSND